MTSLGYFLSCEEFDPNELVRQAVRAESAGFERLWISDHFHPWNNEQGQSPFVWSVIGALSQACSLPITTAVTCPFMRIQPALIAQAVATSAVQLEGRFVLGLGTREALNEHITSKQTSHRGRHSRWRMPGSTRCQPSRRRSISPGSVPAPLGWRGGPAMVTKASCLRAS
jgi:G6PDH family F420-dependent oxidoreductase